MVIVFSVTKAANFKLQNIFKTIWLALDTNARGHFPSVVYCSFKERLEAALVDIACPVIDFLHIVPVSVMLQDQG